MSKRRINRLHIRVEHPKSEDQLPDGYNYYLQEIEKMGRRRAQSIFDCRVSIKESEFAYERSEFTQIAEGNAGFLHLLMAIFLIRLFNELERIISTEEVTDFNRSKNRYMVSAISQRELAMACLTLNEEDVRRLPELHHFLSTNQTFWTLQLSGAMAVMRVINIFLSEHAIVRFPTPSEYVELKIDLIVYFRGSAEGLCIQVKGDQTVPHIRHRTFENIDEETARHDDVRFVHGVRKFQSQFHGIWIPVEISLGSVPFQTEAVRPLGVLKQEVRYFLDQVLTEHNLHDRVA